MESWGKQLETIQITVKIIMPSQISSVSKRTFQFALKYITNFKKIMIISDLKKIIVIEESSLIYQYNNYLKNLFKRSSS